MPTQEFALDPIGTRRVQIFYGGNGGNYTVLLNRSIIGSIANHEGLMAGQEFTLKDGSVLTVRLVNNEYQVMRDGKPLRSMSAADIAAAETKKAAEAKIESQATVLAKAPAAVSSRVSPSAPKLKGYIGYIVVVCGSLLALFAFFSLPYVTFSFLHLTGSQIANQSGIFWLDPIFAVVVAAIAGLQILTRLVNNIESEKAVVLILFLAILDFFILLVRSIFLQPNYPAYISPSSPISLTPTPSLGYGSGFWVYVVAMIVVLIGSIIQMREIG